MDQNTTSNPVNEGAQESAGVRSVKGIDLDAIVAERVGKKVPKFVVNWLKKFIHQDFINTYLKQGRTGVDFCTGTIEYLGVKLDVKGLENLPHDDRKYTFVSNHPLGAIDGVTLGSVLGQAYDGKVKYLVNDLLMNLEGLAPLCVPINKLGKQARSFPAMVDAAFSGEDHVIMFPAGLCSRKQKGVIRDLTWGKSFITKSVKYQRDVVPIHFEGENSKRFYRIANLCKWLHLKFNLAMLFLPDEMYKSQGRHYTVHIGSPIPYQTFDKTKTAQQWAQWVQDRVYEIN